MKKVNFNLIISFCLPFLLLLFSEILFVVSTSIYMGININIITLSLMSLFVYSCFGLLLGIIKRYDISFSIIAGIILIFSFISQIKIVFTDEPLLLSDLLYIGNTGEIFSFIETSFINSIKPIIPLLFFQVFIYFSLIVVAFLLKIKISNKSVRLSIVGGSLLTILLFLLPIKAIDQFVLKYAYNVNNRSEYSSILDYFHNYGNMAGVYGIALENRIYEPNDYDEAMIQDELNSVLTEDNKDLSSPNIIVVFSESFWDIDQLSEIKFDKPVASNFKRLQKEGLFFNMISPSYGGITSNVEFEFLTGGSLAYFNTGYVPCMQLYNNDYYYQAPSIIKELKNAGYKTRLVSLSSPNLFNRKNFYKYLGTDDIIYLDGFAHKKGIYTSDEYITDEIINEFNSKQSGEKLFYMVTTIQSHMPYTENKYDEYDIDIVDSNLSPELNAALRSYAQGVYDADVQLARLYEYIKALDEPTIIVFYGDHLPYLQYQNQNALDTLEFFNTNNSLLNIYRKYNTQSLILANYDISSLKVENDNSLKYLGPDLLSAYILNHMDIDISEYYKWLYNTRSVIGAYNSSVAVDQNGNLYSTQKLDGEMWNLYNLRKNIQYKYFIK